MARFRKGLFLQTLLFIAWTIFLLNFEKLEELQSSTIRAKEECNNSSQSRSEQDSQCRHPSEGSMDIARFHGVGGSQLEFRRTFSTVSKVDLRLWVNFYFCDAPKPDSRGVSEMVVGLRLFVLKGIRLEFNDIFGKLFYSMTIYKTLKYVVNHHHDEKTLRQEKVTWEHMTDHVDEFLSFVEIRVSQNFTGVNDGDERETLIRVNIAGSQMPEYTFKSYHSLEIVQTLSFDCVSNSFDCAEITEVKFGGLSPRTRAEDQAFQLQFLAPHKEMIVKTANLVLERTKESSVQIPLATTAKGTPGQLRVMVGIMSTPGRFEFRLAQRRTWLTHPLVRSGVFVFKFFLSRGASELLNQAMEEEARVFGDVVLQQEGEVYLTIGYKVAQIFNYFTTSEWDHDGPSVIGKSDDDTFKNIEVLYDNLVSSHKNNGVYGHPYGMSQPPTLWYWFTGDTREYSGGVPKHLAGPFYVINSQLVRSWLSLEKQSAWLMSHQMEDRQTGLWIAHYEKTTGQGVSWVTLPGLEEECSPSVTVLHHVVPEDMDCLYSQFVEQGVFTCCGKKGSTWH